MGYIVLWFWGVMAVGVMLVGWVILLFSPSTGFAHTCGIRIIAAGGGVLLLLIVSAVGLTLLGKMSQG